DIGKNIVGVVLACNNYEIIDLGVMVSCDKILQTARERKVDLIGLSGLITPSLEEMTVLAGELERAGFTIPLLIGGATTSRTHTAVRIAPVYSGPVVHVLDASRAVGVASKLLGGQRDGFLAEVREEYQTIRQEREARTAGDRLISFEQARGNRLVPDWTATPSVVPGFLGTQTLDGYPLAELVEQIDWTPFFQTWELKGRFPEILDDPVAGAGARSLYDDARRMLDRIVGQELLRARAVFGFWPAATVGEDIVLFIDETRQRPAGVVHCLRQQMAKGTGRFNLSLADFVAPREAEVADHLGLFAVSTGEGLDRLVAEAEAAHDDFSAILAKALADRLAEAFAERLHQRVRTEYWGYAPGEHLANEELIREQYQG
ncbi:MAG: vitamin B12 dependent-methionine synthase activation domain-containing protein, partial [Gemmatimonadota bacterium]